MRQSRPGRVNPEEIGRGGHPKGKESGDRSGLDQMRRFLTSVATVGVALLMIALPTEGMASPVQSRPGATAVDPIQHVVIVVMENHPFDNYFGTYCQSFGEYCPHVSDGIPPGSCVPEHPKSQTPCIVPYNFTTANDSTVNPPHGYYASTTAYGHGTNDNFYLAEGNGKIPFGHYNGSTLPIYWDMAEEYGIGDRFYSSVLSYSLPNHWRLIAGASPSVAVTTGIQTIAQKHAYLNESNQTPSVEDLLLAHPSVSWDYYDYGLPSYATAINGTAGGGAGGAYDYWNPQAAKVESYSSSSLNSHFVNRSLVFDAAAQGTLPNISWVIPPFNDSDHPPSNVTGGQFFVANLVNAIEAGPDWKSTAIFVLWDDYGGFWDHVVPPSVGPLGLSFRVPLLVISPWTPRGFVSSRVEPFESLLHFVEWRWDLGCLTNHDCNARLPLEYFNFNLNRPPIIFPTNASLARYPIALQGNSTLVLGGSSVPDPTIFDGVNTAAENDDIEPGD